MIVERSAGEDLFFLCIKLFLGNDTCIQKLLVFLQRSNVFCFVNNRRGRYRLRLGSKCFSLAQTAGTGADELGIVAATAAFPAVGRCLLGAGNVCRNIILGAAVCRLDNGFSGRVAVGGSAGYDDNADPAKPEAPGKAAVIALGFIDVLRNSTANATCY